MAKQDDGRPFSQEWLDQLDHERTKAWMLEHRWSFSIFCFDPADIYEIIESCDIEEVDIEDLVEQILNLSKDKR